MSFRWISLCLKDLGTDDRVDIGSKCAEGINNASVERGDNIVVTNGTDQKIKKRSTITWMMLIPLLMVSSTSSLSFWTAIRRFSFRGWGWGAVRYSSLPPLAQAGTVTPHRPATQAPSLQIPHWECTAMMKHQDLPGIVTFLHKLVESYIYFGYGRCHPHAMDWTLSV